MYKYRLITLAVKIIKRIINIENNLYAYNYKYYNYLLIFNPIKIQDIFPETKTMVGITRQ